MLPLLLLVFILVPIAEIAVIIQVGEAIGVWWTIALLITPGFLTDVLGLLFMLPPTRAVVRRLLVRRFAVRMIASVTGPRGSRRAGPRPFDVDGPAVEREQERLDHRR